MDVKMARAMEVKAVKEVAAKVDALTETVAQLIARIDTLVAELSATRSTSNKRPG